MVISLSLQRGECFIARSLSVAESISAKLELAMRSFEEWSQKSSAVLIAVRSATEQLSRGSRRLSHSSGNAGMLNSNRNGAFASLSDGSTKKSTFSNVEFFLNSCRAGSCLPAGTRRTAGSGMARGGPRERDALAEWFVCLCAVSHQVTLVTTLMKLESLFPGLVCCGGFGCKTRALRSQTPNRARPSTTHSSHGRGRPSQPSGSRSAQQNLALCASARPERYHVRIRVRFRGSARDSSSLGLRFSTIFNGARNQCGFRAV